MKLKFNKVQILFCMFLSVCFSISSQQAEVSETKKTVVPQYENILNSSNHLHMQIYKDENTENLVLHNNKKDGKRSLIITSNEKVKRFFYNEHFYLYYAEYWHIGKKVSESNLERVVYYLYPEENSLTDYKKLNYKLETREYVITEKKYIQTFYDSSSRVIEKNEFSLITDSEKLEFKFTENFVKPSIPARKDYTYLFRYDEAGRVVQEDEVHLFYRNDYTLRNTKTYIRKNVYDYVNENIPPVTTFYENNVLRMKTVYTSDKDYVQNIYFDSDTYVKVQYKDGRKVSEVFYVEGKAYE